MFQLDDTDLFKVICEAIILTYILYSQPLIPDRVHHIFEQGLRGERSQTNLYMLSTTQGSIWYHFMWNDCCDIT